MTPISYDLKTAAAMTGLSESHFKRVINSGDLRAKRSSVDERTGDPVGKWVIKAGDLAAYIDSLPDG